MPKWLSNSIARVFKKSNDNIEKEGQGKFIPASLANMIGTEMMQTIIQTNNQYLKSLTSIPINGIPISTLKTEIMIKAADGKDEQSKMTVYDYIRSAEWCLGFELTNCEGQYRLITTHQQCPKPGNGWMSTLQYYSQNIFHSSRLSPQ